MPNLIACRACLAVNIRMHSLSSTWYAEIYEKLAGSKLVIGDGPDTICYLCSSRLQTFSQFFHMSQKAEQKLTLLLENGTEFTQESASMLGINSFNNLTVFYQTPWAIIPTNMKGEIKDEYEDFGETAPFEDIEEEPPQDLKDSFETMETDNNRDSLYSFLKKPVKLECSVKEENESLHSKSNKILIESQGLGTKISNSTKKQTTTFEEKPHRCEQCGATFYSTSIYLAHINKHKRPFPCNECSKSYNEKQHLKRHLLVHTREKPYECHICYKKFNEKGHLTRHIQCLHGDKRIKCRKCNEKFENVILLKAHVTLHSVIKCNECTKQFINKSDLKTHMKTHTRSHPCETCGKIFLRNDYLEVHKMIHSGEKPFTCKCGKSFKSKRHLTQHKTIHTATGETRFTCDRCGKMFNHRGHFTAHLRIHSKPLSCDICEEQFMDMHQLERHKKDHEDMMFECDICAKIYKDKGKLKRHILHHNAPYLFACHTCGKKFVSKYHFETHLRIHTGERPFCCQMCDKTFRDGSHFRAHVKTHSGIKPFACSFCDKTFVRNFTLKKHMLTHTKELPFQCNVCKKGFSSKQNLQGHMRTHTGEKPYCCVSCNKCFRQASHLKTHIKTHPT